MDILNNFPAKMYQRYYINSDSNYDWLHKRQQILNLTHTQIRIIQIFTVKQQQKIENSKIQKLINLIINALLVFTIEYTDGERM